MPQFNPRRVIRQLSDHIRSELFAQHGHPLSAAWDVEEVFQNLKSLPDASRTSIEIILQDLDEVASEDGMRVIVEEAGFRDVDLSGEFAQMDSRFDMAMWVFLHHPELWTAATRFTRADALSFGRSWSRRCDMPVAEPGTGEADIRKLQTALSAFHIDRQCRGHHCMVEHFARGGEQDYYFVYLSDYADTHINFDEEGGLQRTAERRAFEIVFAYKRDSGTLSMFAKGGKKVIEPLQQIFSRVILGEDLPPADPNLRPYALDHLMDRSFGFPTDPKDGIREVSIRCMRLAVLGRSRGRHVLEVDPNAGPDAVYDMLENHLNRVNLPRSILHVTKVTFRFQFSSNCHGRALMFDISYPNSCNLKSKREAHRLLGEKYLKRFGIDVS